MTFTPNPTSSPLFSRAPTKVLSIQVTSPPSAPTSSTNRTPDFHENYPPYSIIAYYNLIKLTMLRSRSKRRMKTSSFIIKLHSMLQDINNSNLITWVVNQPAFIIRIPEEFSRKLLPKYFRHANYASFLRQLSHYSFSKLRSEGEHKFHHPLFERGAFQKHRLIKREQQVELQQQWEENGDLQERIEGMRISQRKLKEACQRLIAENQEVISDNYIFSATLQDQSSNNRIILDRIFSFMLNHPHLQYCDSDTIKGLLNFLDRNDWQSIFAQRRCDSLQQFFRVVESHELSTVVRWISSVFGQRKKRNFTIVCPSTKQQQHSSHQRNDMLSILD